jgi:hypothetical protein
MRFRDAALSVFDGGTDGFAAVPATKNTPVVIRLVRLDAGKLRHGSAAWAFRRVDDLFGRAAFLMRHDSPFDENCAPRAF